MRRARRMRRWLRRRKGAVSLSVLIVLFVAGVAATLAFLPTEGPQAATATRYEELFEHRAIRSDVRGEPVPASVLEHAAPPEPAPVVYDAPVARLRIPSIGVDAEVLTMGILADGTMESPPGPDPVAWYNFTAKPGLGGNAVFSGHVDYIGRGAAIFWDLRKLAEGDVIEVALTDGTVISYSVTASQLYPTESVPMGDVIAPTSTESVTLITCGGTFSAGDYTHRLVLRAVISGITPA